VVHYTGWTWDEVAETVDIPRFEALSRVWSKYPPIPVMLAHRFGMVGDGPPPEMAEDKARSKVIDELMPMGVEVKRQKPLSLEEWSKKIEEDRRAAENG